MGWDGTIKLYLPLEITSAQAFKTAIINSSFRTIIYRTITLYELAKHCGRLWNLRWCPLCLLLRICVSHSTPLNNFFLFLSLIQVALSGLNTFVTEKNFQRLVAITITTSISRHVYLVSVNYGKVSGSIKTNSFYLVTVAATGLSRR